MILLTSGVSFLHHHKIPSWFPEAHWWSCNCKIGEASGQNQSSRYNLKTAIQSITNKISLV